MTEPIATLKILPTQEDIERVSRERIVPEQGVASCGTPTILTCGEVVDMLRARIEANPKVKDEYMMVDYMPPEPTTKCDNRPKMAFVSNCGCADCKSMRAKVERLKQRHRKPLEVLKTSDAEGVLPQS